MSLLDTFLKQGYTPVGQPRKTIDTATGKAGYQDNSSLGNIMKVVSSFMAARQAEQKKREKDEKGRIDRYKALRGAGYSPARAFEASDKGMRAVGPGDEDFQEKSLEDKIKGKIARGETLASGEQQIYDQTMKHKEVKAPVIDPKERIMNKIANGEILTPGEQTVYDDIIKRQEKIAPEKSVTEKIRAKLAAGNPLTPGEQILYKNTIQRIQPRAVPEKIPTVTKQKLYDRITEKVANDQELTRGEQKIYDEVIKKVKPPAAGVNNAMSIDDILSGQATGGGLKEETVPMLGPDGKPWQIYKSKVQAALKKGYKMRNR